MKEKRIVSTVILGIFLLLNLIFAIFMSPISWAQLKVTTEGESSEGAIIAVLFVGYAFALAIILVIIIYAAIIISSTICLLFSIRNRKCTYKPTRIISYVYDGLFGAIIALSVVKIILLLCGI